MKKKSTAKPFGCEVLLSQLLVQTHFQHDFSSSLIIHQVERKEIMIMLVLGYLILISIDFTILFLRFLLSFSFDWEDISSTQDSVWPHFQTPQSSSKILHCTSYIVFSTLFSVFGNVVKHGLSCLIYYVNLCLEFSKVIFWRIKSQSLNPSLPSSFDPDLVNIPINSVQ